MQAPAPYKYDKKTRLYQPNNSSIRIAPSFPTVEEIEQAMEVLSVCVMLADPGQTG
ncbi:MAG: hypothetical protein C4520_06435 [Candidatus Abyssobacteria bacterium SURF_5]|uniref:Uncharacterized protein n=1 Tax=Abyssobacteria bacterium (strain SURF_5) TaxID=2093360 RepID=A0A3A4P5R8_ABYX5|nr:MAG: hypothetical protein C4520_06435 [Candidatus Abyssubacteria bacterium SURF_5]